MGVSSGESLSDRQRRTLAQMMASHAYRELFAARLFGHGIGLAPTTAYRRVIAWHVREELTHYRRVADAYRQLTGERVEPVVHARLQDRPIRLAESWYELSMAQFLYDRGGTFQLREMEECVYEPYRDLVAGILDDERGHQSFGERMVVDQSRSGDHDGEKQAVFERWLREGLLSFGRPDTEGSRYAISAGLKKRDAALVMADYLADIAPTVEACGLRFPALADIGIEGGDALERARGKTAHEAKAPAA